MPEPVEQGEFCPKCGKHIPRFPSLKDETVQKIRDLNPADAIKEVRRITGCEIVTAKTWVVHPTGPHAARIRPPCPYCGELLFSEKTRQCIKCGWDWHDVKSPVQRAVNLTARKSALGAIRAKKSVAK